jgi:hypothetical protein
MDQKFKKAKNRTQDSNVVQAGKTKDRPTKPTLDQLLDGRERIFVMNTSVPKGDVCSFFQKPDGSHGNIVVLKTWIPQEITAQVSHETLRASDDFRRNLNKRMIELMWPDEAIKMLDDEDAQEEAERLYTSKYSSYGTEVNIPERSALSDFHTAMDGADKVKITVKDILERNVPDTEKYHLLRAEDGLSKDDLKYIAVNAEGKAKVWANKQLET